MWGMTFDKSIRTFFPKEHVHELVSIRGALICKSCPALDRNLQLPRTGQTIMGENKDSCAMRLVDKVDPWQEQTNAPGDFLIHVDGEGQRWFECILPNQHYCAIPIRPLVSPATNGGHSWEWDGNLTHPTLTPSVNQVGMWHGWVRAGRMESC